MKITYLIGNGFDISMGLKTSYSDFYHHIKKNKDEEQIKNNCLYRNIDANVDLWKDFETAMGLYTFINTEEFDKKLGEAEKKIISILSDAKEETFNYDKFDSSFQEFNKDFLGYIENREQLFIDNLTDDISIQIINGLVDFSTNLTASWKKILRNQ